MPAQQYRFWCFTNNKIASVEEGCKAIISTKNEKIRFVEWQVEKAPSTGKLHQQGWLQLFQRITETGIRKMYPGIHFEAAKGSIEAQQNYCTKGESREAGPFQEGKMAKKAERTDLEVIVEKLNHKRTITEIINENPDSLRLISHMQKYEQMLQGESYVREVQVTILHGPSGCGKTHSATYGNEKYGIDAPISVYKVDDYKNPFDDYKGEKRIILDEFDGECHMDMSTFKKVTDKWAFRPHCRNWNRGAQWTEVFITTNCDNWTQWYPNVTDAHKAAIARRIDREIMMDAREVTKVP